jgi:hypothetical protein
MLFQVSDEIAYAVGVAVISVLVFPVILVGMQKLGRWLVSALAAP